MFLVLFIGIILINIFYGPSIEDEFAEIFRKIDIDGDGFFTEDELRTSLRKFGKTINDRDVRAIIAEVDLDGDGSGRINMKEWTTFMDD